MDILEIDSLHYSYGRAPVPRGVECAVNTGDILGILGRNGSGKSTLFKIIMGLLRARSGQMLVNRKTVGPRHRVFGYLPQHCFLFKPERVEAIVKMFFPKKSEARERLLADRRIGGLLQMKYRELSVGEKRYFEALLILHLNRPFTLLDEPFKAVDPLDRSGLVALIREKSRVSGIILTDHSYNEMLTVCSRLLILKDGRLLPVEHKKSDLVKRGYLDRSEEPRPAQ